MHVDHLDYQQDGTNENKKINEIVSGRFSCN